MSINKRRMSCRAGHAEARYGGVCRRTNDSINSASAHQFCVNKIAAGPLSSAVAATWSFAPNRRSWHSPWSISTRDRVFGGALMRHLGGIARAAGLKELIAEVLPDNAPMLKVFENSGLPCKVKREAGVVHIMLVLA